MIITGWQVLGVVVATIITLGVICIALGLWATRNVVHDFYDEE